MSGRKEKFVRWGNWRKASQQRDTVFKARQSFGQGPGFVTKAGCD